MTASTSNPYSKASVSFTGKHYSYDVRVEYLVADVESPVQIGPFFVEFRKKAEAAGLTLLDTKGKSFPPCADLQSNEFTNVTQMTKVSTKNGRGKVIFGAIIQGSHTFGEIQQHVFPRHWRQSHSVYIHEHVLGFEYGVHPFFVGNRIKYHPVHGDGEALADLLKHDLEDVWKVAQRDMTTDDDFEKHLKEVEASGVFTNIDGVDELMINVGIERAMMNSGRRDGLGSLACGVFIPRKFGSLLLPLFEYGLLNQDKFDDVVFDGLVVPGLRSENEEMYRTALRSHVQWMNEHRNVSLEPISWEDYKKLDLEAEDGNTYSLEATLYAKAPHVDTVHFFGRPGGRAAKINISTTAEHQDTLIAWLDEQLPQFSFNVKHSGRSRRFNYRGRSQASGDDASAGTGKYSRMYENCFKADDPTAQSFDASTIATSRTTRNPWTRGQNIHCVLDFNAQSTFPTPAQAYPQRGRRSQQPTTVSTPQEDNDQSVNSVPSAVSQLTLENQRLQSELNQKEDALKTMATDMQTLRAEMETNKLSLEAQLTKIMSLIQEDRSPPRKRAATTNTQAQPKSTNAKTSPVAQPSQTTTDDFPMTDLRASHIETPTIMGSPASSVSSNPAPDPARDPPPARPAPAPVPSTFREWIGPRPSDSATHITFGFLNLQGLATKCYPLSLSVPSLLSGMKDYNISLLGVSEHCLPMSVPKTRDHMHRATKEHDFSHLTYRLDSSPEQVDGRLYGGTGSFATDSLACSLDTKGSYGDSLGRWSCMTFRRPHRTPLTVISIYQVCHNPTNKEGTTAWHQQKRGLNDQGRSNTHPRAAFSDDLSQLVSTLLEKQHTIVVGGDWNAIFEEPQSVVKRLCNECGLVDPWLLKNPHNVVFPTQERSSTRRIDSVLMTRDLLDCCHSAAYTPSGTIAFSDHRAVLVTFELEGLLGSAPTPLAPFFRRSVRTSDKDSVVRFIDKLHDHLVLNSAFARATFLEDGGLDISLVEKLDALVGQGGEAAARSVRPRRTAWYSTKVATLQLTVQALNYYLRGLHRNIDRSAVINSRSPFSTLDLTFPPTIVETQALLIQVRATLREARATSAVARQEELSNRADQYEMAHDKNRAKALRKINKQEAAKRAWQAYRRADASLSSRLDRVEIPASWPSPSEPIPDELPDPKTCTSWREITDPKEIEHYLMLRNRLHFGQAHGTPFTVPPLSTDLDWAASTQTADEILAGTYDNPDLSPDTQLVLKYCKQLCDLDSIPAELTKEEFRGKIKKWRESTSTSPSGRHLGWYKSLFVEGIYPDGTDEYWDFSRKQDEIVDLLLTIMNHCIRHGYSLQRWRTVVNTMIFKDVGIYKIHRLRVLHIYEADFNLLLGVKWRQLLWEGEKSDLLHPGQYGGRPGREATTLALMEELRLDIAYVTRRILIHFDADAASCYDRIIFAMASIINRHIGLHRNVVLVHAKTLQEAKYKLRTSMGISELEYQHCEAYPIYGTGQGSGNSPCIWLFISLVLFRAHSATAHGAHFESPDGTISVCITLVGFVDDTNAAGNSWQPQTDAPLSDIVTRMLHDAQSWTNLLHVSGGKLEISKSSFHVLHFNFLPNGSAIPESMPPSGVPFELQDPSSGQQVSVPCKWGDSCHKTLGHWKSPIAPRPNAQLKKLISRADTISRHIVGSSQTRYGAFLGYQLKYLPAIKYPLPQSFFTAAQLESAEQHSRARLVSKCGYNCHTSHGLIFLPPEYAGAGFVHWYTLQGEGQITQFLKHWRTDTDTSSLLRIDLAWSQEFSGLGTPLLENPTVPTVTIPSRWLPSLRGFLHSIDSTITVDQSFVHPMEREGDEHIMDYVRSRELFSTQKDLDLFNYCRLHMQVNTLSELISVDGRSLLPYVRQLIPFPWLDPNRNIILQHRPSDYQIRTKWKPFLDSLIDTTTNEIRAAIFLGAWKSDGTRRPCRRQVYVVYEPNPVIYYWRDGYYWQATPRSSSYCYHCSRATEWEPTAQSIPLQLHSDAFPLLFVTEPLISVPTPLSPANAPTNFTEYLRTASINDYRLLEMISWEQPPTEALHTILTLPKTDRLLVVSDGSSRELRTMSYGAIIGTQSGTVLVSVCGPAFGHPSSNRAEGTGTYAAVLLLTHLLHYCHCNVSLSCHVETVSDNRQVLNWLKARQDFTYVYANDTLKTDYDLLEATHQKYADLALTHHNYVWVKGHQDSSIKFSSLTRRAQYNCLADEIADLYCKHIDASMRPITPILPGTRCVLNVQGSSVTSHYLAHIRRAASMKDFRLHLFRNHAWDDTTFDSVCWSAFQRAARNYSSSDVHLMKLVYQQLPTKFLLHRDKQHLQKCSHCDHPETQEHLMTEPCNEVTSAYHKAIISRTETYLMKVSAPTTFRALVKSALHRGLGYENHPLLDADLWDPYDDLFQSQNTIGWYHFIRGFWSDKWLQVYSALRPDCDLDGNDFSDHEDGFSTGAHSIDSEPSLPPTPEWELDIEVSFIENSHATRPLDGYTVIAGTIRTFWTETTALWLHRCDAEHGPGRDSPLHLASLRDQLRSLHALREQVHPADRNELFRPDLEEFLESATVFQLRNHIASVKPYILRSKRRYMRRPKSQSLITTFFQTIRTAAATGRRQVVHRTNSLLRSSMISPASAESDHRKVPRKRRMPRQA